MYSEGEHGNDFCDGVFQHDMLPKIKRYNLRSTELGVGWRKERWVSVFFIKF